MSRCVIIGASGDMQKNIKQKVKDDDYVICADGGYDIAVSNGITPNLVVGDFDSIENTIKEGIPIIKLPCEKDDTDMMFCAKKAIEWGYTEVLLLAATGKRLDHTIANLSVLLFLVKNGTKAYISDDLTDIYIVVSGKFFVYGNKPTTVSVMPFGTESCTVTYNGLKYPLIKGEIKADFPLGISNELISKEAEIIVDSGPAMIIVPKE